jgi:nicotinate-nucleotide--dimethylbenzimidazole phosphoribosyltransferase
MITVPMYWKTPSIPATAKHLAPALQSRIDNKTKPPGALGRLEELALQIGQIQATVAPRLVAPHVLVFAGDHGLAREGVSPFPPEVTPQMVLNFLAGGAGINVFARLAGLALTVVDAGVAGELPPHPGLLPMKVRAGTRNSLYESALTKEEVSLCLERGARIVASLADKHGTNAVLPGEMGIGNSAAAALLYSAFTGRPVAECTGRGAGHDDAGLARKIAILEQVQARHGCIDDPVSALAAYGGCEIAMMTGAMLEAASRRMIVMVDGFICTAAALVAARMAPGVVDYFIFAHASGDGPHRVAVDALGGRPLLNLGMRLGEGTGAALAWPLVRAAVAFLDEMATFESAGVSEREGVVAT